jgi:hypothetical protein
VIGDVVTLGDLVGKITMLEVACRRRNETRPYLS